MTNANTQSQENYLYEHFADDPFYLFLIADDNLHHYFTIFAAFLQ